MASPVLSRGVGSIANTSFLLRGILLSPYAEPVGNEVSVKKHLVAISGLCLAISCSSGKGQPGSGTGGNGSGGRGSGGAETGGKGGTGGTVGSGGNPGTGGADGKAGSSGNGGAVAGGGSGSGGASANDGGTGETVGGSTNLVVPAKVPGTNKYGFSFGDVVFEVDQQVGARVATLSLGGSNMIVSTGSDNTQWGSVFWTSPRSDWTPRTWPPPTAYDGAAYSGGPAGDHLVLDGPTDASMGISFSKDYAVDSASGWINITYIIKTTKAVKAAPWEDTRVPRGGLAFFPAGTSLVKGPLTMSTTAGIVWFDDASMSATSSGGSKATADGSDGWSAYALGGSLFLKKFADQPASAQVPSEGEIAIYPGVGFLEVEVQGPYTSIGANESLTWSVQWRVAKIPDSVTVSAGSSSLVDFARQQVAM
jgi:hypothetical protein